MLLLSLKDRDRLQTCIPRCWTEGGGCVWAVGVVKQEEEGSSRSELLHPLMRHLSQPLRMSLICALRLMDWCSGLWWWINRKATCAHTHAYTRCCLSDRIPCDSGTSTGSIFSQLIALYPSLLVIKLIWLEPYCYLQAMFKPRRSNWLIIDSLGHWWTLFFSPLPTSSSFGGLFDPFDLALILANIKFFANYSTNTSAHWLLFWEIYHSLCFLSWARWV